MEVEKVWDILNKSLVLLVWKCPLSDHSPNQNKVHPALSMLFSSAVFSRSGHFLYSCAKMWTASKGFPRPLCYMKAINSWMMAIGVGIVFLSVLHLSNHGRRSVSRMHHGVCLLICPWHGSPFPEWPSFFLSHRRAIRFVPHQTWLVCWMWFGVIIMGLRLDYAVSALCIVTDRARFKESFFSVLAVLSPFCLIYNDALLLSWKQGQFRTWLSYDDDKHYRKFRSSVWIISHVPGERFSMKHS